MVSPTNQNNQYKLEEYLLDAGVVGIDDVLAKDPQLASVLDGQLNNISQTFSKIMESKYNLNVQQEIANLSPTEVDSLESQIASVQSQINSINNVISGLQSQLATEQSAVTSDTANVNSVQTQINAQQNTVGSDQATVTGYIGTNSTAGSIANYSLSIQDDMQNTFYGDTLLNNLLTIDAGEKLFTGVPTVSQLQGLITDTQNFISSNNLNSTQLADMNSLISQMQNAISSMNTLSSDQATLSNLQNVTLPAAQQQLSTDQATLYNTETNIINEQDLLTPLDQQLASLQAQLTSAQALVNQAIASFNQLTPIEKTLFQELYPNVSFPPFTPVKLPI